MFDGFFSAGTYQTATLWRNYQNGFLYVTNTGSESAVYTMTAGSKIVRVLTDTAATYTGLFLKVTVAPHETAVLKLTDSALVALYRRQGETVELVGLYKKGTLIPYIGENEYVKEFAWQDALAFLLPNR